MVTGARLRADREALGIKAIDIAAVWDRDEAIISRIEAAASVSPEKARAYRRALMALAKQRAAAKRDLIRELAAL